MIQVIQPLLSALIGLALAIYGFVHTSTHVPVRHVFTVFWAALPSAVAVLVFLLGMFAIGIGLTLLVHGIQGIRQRTRTLNHMFRHADTRQIENDDPDYEPGYGYR